MDPALVLILIFVLAAVLAATGIVLNRRSQRRAPSGEVAPPSPAPPPAPTGLVTAVPEADVALEPVPDVEADLDVEAAPNLRDRLGRTRGAFLRSLAAIRGRGTVDDATWEELEDPPPQPANSTTATARTDVRRLSTG